MKIDLFYDDKEKSTKFRLLEALDTGMFIVPVGFISDRRKHPPLSLADGQAL